MSKAIDNPHLLKMYIDEYYAIAMCIYLSSYTMQLFIYVHTINHYINMSITQRHNAQNEGKFRIIIYLNNSFTHKKSHIIFNSKWNMFLFEKNMNGDPYERCVFITVKHL